MNDIAMRVIASLVFLGILYLSFEVSHAFALLFAFLFYVFVLDLFGFVIVKKVRAMVSAYAKRIAGQGVPGTVSRSVAILPESISVTAHLFERAEFIVYFDSPKGTAYQVLMWLPYLEMLGRPFRVVTRQAGTTAELRAAGVPAIYLKSISELDEAIGGAPIKAVFYVNNAMRNMHVVRYNNFVHIQLLHGESDKPSSYNPVCKMFDFLFVSGQLAIDRYALNDVFIEDRKFRIVSRPQVASIDAGFVRGGEIRTVFYALTWGGLYANQDLSSIESAEVVVRALMERGYRVIFRPHPLSYEHRAHKAIIGRVASMLSLSNEADGKGHCISNDPRFDRQYPTANDCINASDFMIADVTSIIGDWLYSKKPFAIIDPHSDQAAFVAANPLAAGAYYIDRQLSALDAVLADVATVDSLYERRVASREYALGIGPDGSPVDTFLHAARDVLDNFDKISFERDRISQEKTLDGPFMLERRA